MMIMDFRGEAETEKNLKRSGTDQNAFSYCVPYYTLPAREIRVSRVAGTFEGTAQKLNKEAKNIEYH